MYESQWLFVPENIKEKALIWQLKVAQSLLSSVTEKLKNGRLNNSKATIHQVDDFAAAKDALDLLFQVHKNGHQKLPEFSLALFIDTVKKSELRGTFSGIFEQSSLLKPVVISLVRNAKDLWEYNHKAFEPMGTEEVNLTVFYHPVSGFDRLEIINTLRNTPELFANPSARASTDTNRQYLNHLLPLTNQLLGDIKRELVVAYKRDPHSESGGGV